MFKKAPKTQKNILILYIASFCDVNIVKGNIVLAINQQHFVQPRLNVLPYLSEAEEKADPSDDAQHLPSVLLDLRGTSVTCGMSETSLKEEQNKSQHNL